MNEIAYEGMSTPWGKAQDIEIINDSMAWVSTESHGGIKVSPYLNTMIPKILREKGGWYEEDCQWSIPFFFCQKIDLKNMNEHVEAHKTLKNQYWYEYEIIFRRWLAKGESLGKDKYLWETENAEKFKMWSALRLENGLVRTWWRVNTEESKEIILTKETLEKLRNNETYRTTALTLEELESIAV